MLELLKTEYAAVQRFVNILKQEQVTLINADVETLIALSSNKIKQSEELRAMVQLRNHQLKQAGFSEDRSGMQAWVTGQPTAIRKDIQKIWDDLILAGKEAQRLNETNGKLIETHLQHNQQALGALTSAANQANVYGRDGQPHVTGTALGRTRGKV